MVDWNEAFEMTIELIGREGRGREVLTYVCLPCTEAHFLTIISGDREIVMETETVIEIETNIAEETAR